MSGERGAVSHHWGLLEVTNGDCETAQEKVPERLGRDVPGHLRLIAAPRHEEFVCPSVY
jgi:hypothetical protein